MDGMGVVFPSSRSVDARGDWLSLPSRSVATRENASKKKNQKSCHVLKGPLICSLSFYTDVVKSWSPLIPMGKTRPRQTASDPSFRETQSRFPLLVNYDPIYLVVAPRELPARGRRSPNYELRTLASITIETLSFLQPRYCIQDYSNTQYQYRSQAHKANFYTNTRP